MATNQQTLLRQWHMLRLIPRAPAKVSVQDLQDRLGASGFDVHQRSIQRDLKELEQVFPLVIDARDKPYGWSWHRDGASFDLPGLGIPEALMLNMVDQHMQNHLPPATLDALRPYFKTASQALANATGSANSNNWLNKIRSVVPMQPLLAPIVDETSQRVVYQALMHEQQLKLTYRKRDAAVATVYDGVHPLAVVQRGKLIYLVCRLAGRVGERMLPLHRVVAAEMLADAAHIDADFSIDEYIRSGAFGFGKGGDLKLEAIFTRACGEHLFETPLSADQTLHLLDDDHLSLVATVSDSKALVWWLLGLGDGVEVLTPIGLRQQMKETTQRMASMYQ
ncbi:helix-turn-helix transcriptional regulator [Actimicrobium sp. CCI2.3]|uniref:helix-turn-helix transcriptional regulator n=2 Tax=Actimicrobium sp. CCI2.3 TaxID=3048616 RepID=UPI002B24A08F|nr:WYL domain-containing protein [Actimicrobium sp. CCI2.3]